MDRFFAGYRELDKAPAVANLKAGFKQLQAFHDRLVLLTTEVEAELEQWRRLPPETGDEAQRKRSEATRTTLERQMPEFRSDLAKIAKKLAKGEASVGEATRVQDWD